MESDPFLQIDAKAEAKRVRRRLLKLVDSPRDEGGCDDHDSAHRFQSRRDSLLFFITVTTRHRLCRQSPQCLLGSRVSTPLEQPGEQVYNITEFNGTIKGHHCSEPLLRQSSVGRPRHLSQSGPMSADLEGGLVHAVFTGEWLKYLYAIFFTHFFEVFGSTLGALGFLLLSFSPLIGILMGMPGFMSGANTLVGLGAAASPEQVTTELVAVAAGSGVPASTGNYIFGLMIAARLEGCFLAGVGLVGLYAVATQPLAARNMLHLVMVVTHGLAVFVHLHHLGMTSLAVPPIVVDGPVKEMSYGLLAANAVQFVLHLVGFFASRPTPEIKLPPRPPAHRD